MVGTVSNNRLSRLFGMITVMVAMRFASICIAGILFAAMLTYNYVESDRITFYLPDQHYMSDAGHAEKIRRLGNNITQNTQGLRFPIEGKCLMGKKRCTQQDSVYVSLKKQERAIEDGRELRLGYAKGFWIITGLLVLACLVLRSIKAKRV